MNWNNIKSGMLGQYELTVSAIALYYMKKICKKKFVEVITTIEYRFAGLIMKQLH